MVECDYCGASFDDEDAYLDHLAASHEGELGAIDQRRVDGRASDGEASLPLGVVAGGVIVLVAAAVVVYVTQLSGGAGVDPDGIESAELSESGDAERLSDVETVPNEGNRHVQAGSNVDYARQPPLSGPHYNTPTEGGFYGEEQEYGNLVHALEHGAVVVYYDPSVTDSNATNSLQEFAATHTGQWRSFIAVPNPDDDPEADYVLTAWRNRLYMDSYDPQTVYAFLSEFLGRGPENPVR